MKAVRNFLRRKKTEEKVPKPENMPTFTWATPADLEEKPTNSVHPADLLKLDKDTE